MSNKILGGANLPVEVVTTAPDNKVAIPVYGALDRPILGGPSYQVYIVSQAQIDSGEYKLMPGPAQPVYELAGRSLAQGVMPVYVIGGTLGATPDTGPTYLLLDRFTTDAAAPLASPRTCEPGPGTLTLVQTDGEFSISSGALNFPAQATPADTDQGFYDGVGMSAVAGRAFLVNQVQSTIGSIGCYFALKASAGVNVLPAAGARYFIGSQVNLFIGTGTTAAFIVAAPLIAGTSYSLTHILRGTGCFHLIKGGIYSEWSMLWVSSGSIGTPVYLAFSNYNSIGTLDNLRVTDLPSPWTDDYGIATQRLAGSVAAGTTFTHEADCLIEFVVTTLPSGGDMDVLFRMQDGSNYWRVRINPTGGLFLTEVVAGTPTNRGSVAGVVADGDRIVIVAAGTTIRVYEANTLRITYASAANFATETDGELDALGTAGVASDLISWPRTLSGTALSTLSAV